MLVADTVTLEVLRLQDGLLHARKTSNLVAVLLAKIQAEIVKELDAVLQQIMKFATGRQLEAGHVHHQADQEVTLIQLL